MFDCRLIVDPPFPGPMNMAVDETLLHDAADSGIASLRFYAWSEPTLSLGYFQRYDDREQHAASRDCALIRRQTGGGAILHDRELTYSIVLPAAHPLALRAEQLYAAVHDAFIAELSVLLAAQHAPRRLWRLESELKPPAGNQPFLCFQRRARGDVFLGTTNEMPELIGLGDPFHTHQSHAETTTKLLGSAQRRHRGAILQHGSLLLQRSPFAPELAGWRDLSGIEFETAALIDNLAGRFADLTAARICQTTISPELELIAGPIANNKYGSPAWTKRR